ncbi:MAG: peptidase [Hyphomicrobium sp.]|nr:peptidase [Hyphomicrobium sp.]
MPSRTLNRILWAIALLLIVVFGFQARDQFDAMFIGVGRLDVRAAADDDTVYLQWRGKIEAPMLSEIDHAFAMHQSRARRIVLSLSSPGGSLDHGAKVVRLLRRIGETHKLETVVAAGSRCASMCVPVYLQGQRRSAAPSAKFMFHEVSFRDVLAEEDASVPERAIGSATDRLFSIYFAPAGVPEDWIRGVRAAMAGGNDIWKTGQELIDENAGIVQLSQ